MGACREYQRSVLPLVLAIAGALFAAFAMLADGGRVAGALENCTTTSQSNDAEETAFLGLINGYRQSNGLGALTISTNLNRGAAWIVEDMAAKGYFAHTDSLGRSPYARALDCGYPSGAGENLAAGGAWSSAQAAFEAWQSSPGHNANMLGSYYQQIGIARYFSAGSQYGWYWATTFGATNDGTGGGGAGNPTNTPTSTPTRTPTAAAATSTPTTVPPTSTPTTALPTSTPTPNNGGGGNPNPTPPLPTSTPTANPTSSGGPAAPTPPLATSTPTPRGATNTPAPSTATPAPANTPAPAATPSSPAGSLPLAPGANLVAWPGGTTDPAEAFAGNTVVSVVYEWDPQTGAWKRYFPGLPAYLNNLRSLRQGGAYWVIAKNKTNLVVGW